MSKSLIKWLKGKINGAYYKLFLRFYYLYNQDSVFVTGADSSHYKSLCQLLCSLLKYESKSKILVYDLGLTNTEINYININFSAIELRSFDYSKYPKYLNIKINAGEYAWKPVIVNNVMNEFKCTVCWLDAGNVVIEPLLKLKIITKKLGFYSPYSCGKISDWTHPKTLNYLNASESILNYINLNGACVSVDYSNKKANKLINTWATYALIKECIAPEGSGRHNHRQDQAVLTVLAYQSGLGQKMIKDYLGFKIHQDMD
jgi:hypothetical protein